MEVSFVDEIEHNHVVLHSSGPFKIPELKFNKEIDPEFQLKSLEIAPV